jgi:DNA-binding NtrC family response regulator
VSKLIVLTATRSFSSFWPELAEEIGTELAVTDSSAEVGSAAGSLAVLAVVAGSEEIAEPLLRELAAAGSPPPLLIGASADHRLAIELVQSGAANYFALPSDLEPLKAELRERAARLAARTARESLAETERAAFDFSKIIGESPGIRAALGKAARVIPRGGATLLITGDTGTGKEVLAHAIHYNGPRAESPFVEVNCTAIPENLVESELFGHEKGAFTGAAAAKPGLFEAADGGTLFLDEIGHLPFDLQGKLLKALEEKRIRRVGSVQSRPVNVRIIAATHVDLAGAVRRGEFREDLYYRLSVVPIHLPPLSERGDDVILLAEHFLRTLSEEYGIPTPPVTASLSRALLSHRWPGNVRELRNALERALLLGNGEIQIDDLFLEGRQPMPESGGPIPFPAPLHVIDRAAAQAMMKRVDGNKSAAAEALEISRSRLYRLLAGESD